jgi:hypothetical protein
MRIDWTPPLRPSTARRDSKSSGSSDERFSAQVGGEHAPAPASATSGLASVDGLLSLQELPDALTGRRRAIQRGNQLLDRLEDIRLGLLTGTIPRERLSELARMAREARDNVDDPQLSSLLDDIHLRAAVELAKLGQL